MKKVSRAIFGESKPAPKGSSVFGDTRGWTLWQHIVAWVILVPGLAGAVWLGLSVFRYLQAH